MKITLACSSIFWFSQAKAIDPDLARFATAKQNQIREFAKTLTNKVPEMVWSFFDAVRVDDWETATNLEARLREASGRVSGNPSEPAFGTLLWSPIQEMIGAYGEFHAWDSKWLQRFGREIIDSIPRGSVYFGGTDPGRFIVSAKSESHREGKPFFTLTQNQLADGNYLEYLRKIYGGKLKMLTAEDYGTAFTQYVALARQRLDEGRLKQGEDFRMVDGQPQIRGPVAVMEVNGLMVKMILDRNPSREFYLEESYPLEWTYPYLSPHGFIFELHHEPLKQLTPEMIDKNQAYWKGMTAELIGDWISEKTSVKELCDFSDNIYLDKNLAGFKGSVGFAKNRAAQMTFSKLRSSIAGIYVWRAEHAQDPEEKKSMQRAAEIAFRQAYALCPYSPEAVFRYAQLLTELKRPDDAFLVGKTTLRLEPQNQYFQDLVRSLRKAQ